jgi:hypothetical protein
MTVRFVCVEVLAALAVAVLAPLPASAEARSGPVTVDPETAFANLKLLEQ